MSDLQGVVTDTLTSLGFPWTWASRSLIEARVPPEFRHHFGRGRLRLTFDASVWEYDRGVELVVPGCVLLENLESCLRDCGAARSIVFGGCVSPGPEMREEWRQQIRVLNAELVGEKDLLRWGRTLRLLFEARLPGPPPTTELLPVFYDLAQRSILRSEVASVFMARDRHWYQLEEVRALVREPVEWPSPGTMKPVIDAASGEVRKRVKVLLHADGADRGREVEQEKHRLRAEFEQRLWEAESDEDRQEMREELERRLGLLDESLHGGASISLVSATLLAVGDQALEVSYRSSRTSELVTLRPKVKNGHVLLDLCSWCSQERSEYLLVPGEQNIVCTSCGVACRDDHCGVVLRHSSSPLCVHCQEPAWCEDHVFVCAACGERCCPEHGGPVSCCEDQYCSIHVHEDAETGETLCPKHGADCSVDGKWRHIVRMLTCELTGERFFEGHRIELPGDDRIISPNAIVTCASSGRRVARDRAKPCAADGRMHHLDELVRCAVTKAWLCPEHRTKVQLPAVMVVDSRRAVTCSELGVAIDRSVAGTCSVSGNVYHRDKLTTCPATERLLHPSQARVIDGDGRKLHPSAVLFCSATGEPIASDRCVPDQFASDAPLHPDAAVRCELSNKTTARSRTEVVACCGRRVAKDFVARTAISGRLACSEHRQHCEHHGNWVMPDEAVTCPITGKKLCIEHTRLVDCCGRRVAKRQTLAIGDGKLGCTEHWVSCGEGGHPVPREQTRTCSTTGRPVCAEHGVICACHHGFHQRSLLTEDPYQPGAFFCSDRVRGCGYCGLEAPKDANHESACRYCAAALTVTQDPPSFLSDAYQRRVVPLLPWYQVSIRVVLSGTEHLAVVTIATLLGHRQLFHVYSDGRIMRKDGAGPWVEVVSA